ncbi:hypothetical protein KO481_18745 [Nocardia sp. NEAU-G5]|uniref:Dnd system-associated protein 4 n=1 Tax=Nocardia albiluteola TaxID=2842303 RepID=A0ABS6AZS5_9NOCA|nr:hypothetical protein [Nocardia albiluteola]MBU3063560.1 hypothetical protein [Nocardia albiluteola]
MAMMDNVRVRRPRQHEQLFAELQEDASFPTIRDIMILAAAIGFHVGRRVSFTFSGEHVRYEALTARAYSETLINMIAASVSSEDPEIMDDARLGERIELFEEYVNGGLEYIREQMNTQNKPVANIIVDLVTEAFTESGESGRATVEELLGGVDWP